MGPQWIRWTLAGFIIVGAFWAEFRGETTVGHPFTTQSIERGEAIGPANTESRRVPNGLFNPTSDTGFATRRYEPGEPLLPSGISPDPPTSGAGWWALEVDLVEGARVGDEVRLVLVDTGDVIPGVVSAIPDDDVLGPGTGAVAVPPQNVASAATAVASGRYVVLISHR